MKSLLPRVSAFFLITLLPVVYLHVAKLPVFAEVIDGILSSFVFTLPFALGTKLIRRAGWSAQHSVRQEMIAGAISAALMWSLIWVAWSVIPFGLRESAESWAFFSHLLAALGTGLLAGMVWGSRASTV